MDHQPEEKKIVNKFSEDCRALFSGQLSGNLWPYLYSEPQNENDPVRGSMLYNEMLEKEKDYYLYKNEMEFFQNCGELIASFMGTDITFIELGPGGEKSFRSKTLPFLRNFSHLQGYVGIDICWSFLKNILEIVRIEFPNLFVTGFHQDFTQIEQIPTFAKSVIFFKGSTIGNLRNTEVPILVLRFRQLISEGHYLVIANDTNQDEVSLMKAYDNLRMASFMKNIMYRINRDLNVVNMVPSAFSYRPEWDPTTYDLRHILIATQRQKFYFQEQPIEIEEGQKLHILSSFKYPVTIFQEMVSSAGFVPIDVFFDASKKMAIHLFKAI